MAETVKLQACDMGDDDFIEVQQGVAMMSETIKNMWEDVGGGSSEMTIPLHNVTQETLTKVIEYCTYHSENPTATGGDEKDLEEISPWDKEYCQVDQNTLFELILAANYLDIKPLLDLTCKTVANMIKGKTPEEIRQMFNIKNDFTPEEEEKIRRENEWIEERG